MIAARRIRLPATGMLLACLAASVVRGQAPTFDEWRLLEPAQEMTDYKNKLREGVFDDASKTFAVTTVLPQLALRKNRHTIDRVRRRMRELLCGDGSADPKAAASATQVVADFMTAQARDGKADPVVQVNSMLLVGELNGPGKKPWTPAVAMLAAAIADERLPPAVRIAAAAGLARHVDADPAARGADAGPPLLALVKSPLAGIDPVAADWLRSRALSMLDRMGAAAPAGTAAAAAKVLLDESRPVDVRVRAAATVGGTVKAPGDTDVTAAITAIRGLAVAALAATKGEDDRRRLVATLADGAQPPQAQPAVDPGLDGAFGPAVDAQRYRRDAWRLATLADALAPSEGDGGLARVAGAGAEAATALASSLRQGAEGLDAQPDGVALAAALDLLGQAGGEPVGGSAPGGPATPATPAAEPAGTDGVPFGDR